MFISLLELILEWQEKLGLPETSVALSKYGHKTNREGGGGRGVYHSLYNDEMRYIW